jgi:predicted Rossmann fold flavoprotein
MKAKRVAVVGGGAAGFFGAIACAAANRAHEITIFEKTAQFLQKVRISGGGRCNVTHACFEARELTRRYPRGEKELIGPYHSFQARDTVQWFESRGVKLKIEPDGRMFPTSDNSQTIIDCLLAEARRLGIRLQPNHGIDRIVKRSEMFELTFTQGEKFAADAVLLATGGCRTPALGRLAVELGHTLAPPVPSLFTFHIELPWVRALAGVSVPSVELSVPETRLKERGALLFTHWGLSGPAVLRLSAWGARELAERNYQFQLQINWIPNLTTDQLRAKLEEFARQNGARLVSKTPFGGLPARLWENLTGDFEVRWSQLGKTRVQQLLQRLARTELPVTGKSLNKDEFVTCGGVRLAEVNFKTMESRMTPGIYFAGELLDIDGITGGFNFQAAWTTGWIAGNAIARQLCAAPAEARNK